MKTITILSGKGGVRKSSITASLAVLLAKKEKIVLNRSDIVDKEIIEKTVEKFNSKIIAEIPYSKKIQEAYSEGKVIKDKAIKEIAGSLR
ncbi:P-loop NTPase [Candidatus Pacearchaeota archaeon]|nr:P-loop NTPase [Candidatus Pacearchaeota archaeon]